MEIVIVIYFKTYSLNKHHHLEDIDCPATFVVRPSLVFTMEKWVNKISRCLAALMSWKSDTSARDHTDITAYQNPISYPGCN